MKRLLFSLVILALFYYPAQAAVFAAPAAPAQVEQQFSQFPVTSVGLQVLSAPTLLTPAVVATASAVTACPVAESETSSLVQDQAVLNFNVSASCFRLSLGNLTTPAPLKVVTNPVYSGKIVVSNPDVIKDELESNGFPAGDSQPFLPQPLQLALLTITLFSLTYKSKKGIAETKSFQYQTSLTELQMLRC